MGGFRRDQILNSFRDLLPSIRGILLFGSRVMGYAEPESDIDICLILSDSADRVAVHDRMLLAPEQYDIIVYDEIPWYLRGRVLEHHRVIYAEDPDDLDFWLYKQRRIWEDMKRRQEKASVEDLLWRPGHP
mgnify:CR=1 FL=1